MDNTKKARIIAFYLPQFHPIPENDKWWGKGFTEWTNVGKSKPLFKGHYQPRVPSDLGYYDLRLSEVREAQANMAKEAGIEGFMYWHYWFGNNKTVLDMPFKEVLKTGKPNFPFCFGWANHSWSNKTWVSHKTGKTGNNVIFQQEYLGITDYIKHFEYCLPAFLDERYIKVHNKPLFYIYNPLDIKDWEIFSNTWNELAIKNGLEGIHFVGSNCDFAKNIPIISNMKGMNGIAASGFQDALIKISGFLRFKIQMIIHNKYDFDFGSTMKYPYKELIKYQLLQEDKKDNIYPVVIPQMDSTPRRGKKAVVVTDSTPALFKKHLNEAVSLILHKNSEDRLIFLRSWNEWGEGNYVEPDLKYGHDYLNAIKDVIIEK
jgi:hypothetical protein